MKNWFRNFWQEIKPTVNVYGNPGISLCSYRGGALAATPNGTIYLIDESPDGGFPRVQEVIRLRQ